MANSSTSPVAGDGTRREIPRAMVRTLWAAALLLVAIGVAAAIGRAVFPDDVITRAEPARQWYVDALHLEDPLATGRPAELARMDGSFAAHPRLTLLHIVPGGLFLLLAPLQFSTRIRTRYIRLHRWSGRILLPMLLVTVAPGVYFGVFIPFGGPGEALAIAVFATMLVVAVCQGFLAIRRRQVARHREWMIRVFAIAAAISTVRIVGAPLDVALTPAGFTPAEVFVIAVWTAWAITIGAAEAWIRYTRLPGPPRST